MARIPKVVLVDFGDTNIQHADLLRLAAALQVQVNTEFCQPPPLGYGQAVAYVRTAKTAHDVQPDEWVCGFLAHPDVAGAFGYHDRTPHGLPFMKCFPLLDAQDGQPWQPTPSHELLETLKDPELALCAQAPDGAIWAYEVCDAVEEDIYYIQGVPVSNWSTPAWFEPPADLTGIRFDWMSLCTQAFEIRPGGYGQTWDGSEWQEVQSQAKTARAFRASVHRGRRTLRREKVIR